MCHLSIYKNEKPLRNWVSSNLKLVAAKMRVANLLYLRQQQQQEQREQWLKNNNNNNIKKAATFVSAKSVCEHENKTSSGN